MATITTVSMVTVVVARGWRGRKGGGPGTDSVETGTAGHSGRDSEGRSSARGTLTPLLGGQKAQGGGVCRTKAREERTINPAHRAIIEEKHRSYFRLLYGVRPGT